MGRGKEEKEAKGGEKEKEITKEGHGRRQPVNRGNKGNKNRGKIIK